MRRQSPVKQALKRLPRYLRDEAQQVAWEAWLKGLQPAAALRSYLHKESLRQHREQTEQYREDRHIEVPDDTEIYRSHLHAHLFAVNGSARGDELELSEDELTIVCEAMLKQDP